MEKHHDAVNVGRYESCNSERIDILSNSIECNCPARTLTACCIPNVVRLNSEDVLYEKAYMSPRPPPKISLRHDWTKELGSKVVQQPEGEVTRQQEGEVARQAKFFQPTQPIPNSILDRSGQLGITQDVIVVQDERKTSRSQQISVNSFDEELCSSDRSGQPGITQDMISVQACSSEDSKSLNVEQTHDRSGHPGKNAVAVQDDLEVYHEAVTLNNHHRWIRVRRTARGITDCFGILFSHDTHGNICH